MAKRRFGRIRRLPSGRYQARYQGPDGIDRPAGQTFASKRDAEVWLTLKEAEIVHGHWIDPDAGRVPFSEYAAFWVAERPNLRPKTVQLYEGLVRHHLVPVLGQTAVADIRERTVRRWRKTLLDESVGPVTVAKAYRLLKAIMNTAVDDGMIRRNPCRIKGAGQEHCSLRWGELAGLQRADVDSSTGILTVHRSVTELAKGPLVTGPPKSGAGRRSVTIPEFLLTDVKAHLDEFSGPDADAFVFTGVHGNQLRRSNFTRPWRQATEAVGMAGFHFHDLRHTGNTLAGEAGASLRELMDRMGHSTTRAAYIYQHRTSARDKLIADAISKRVRAERRPLGTQRARGKKEER